MNTILANWINSTGITKFDFSISLDGGATWTLLAANVTGSVPPYNTYGVPMPVIVHDQVNCLLKVADHDLPTIFAVSAHPFSILYNLLNNLDVSIAYLDGTNTQISWSTSKDARSQVFYSQDPLNLNSASVKDNTYQSSHSHLLGGLNPYHLYYYNVRSDTDFEIAVSTGSFQFIPSVPLAFTAYGAITVDGNLVTLDWASNQYAYGQVIYGSGNTLNLSTPVYDMAMLRQITINNLFLNTNYYFQVLLQRPSGPPPDVGSISSGIIAVRTTGDVTIEDIMSNPATLITIKNINETCIVTTPSIISERTYTVTPEADETTLSVTAQPIQKKIINQVLTPPSASIIGTEVTYSVA